MKRFATLTILFPGAALAHGGHAPVPEAAHALSHAGPAVGALVIVLATGLALTQRWRS
ncbi:MAG: hypothetical protein AB3N11_08725 [Arenibacterium sp.]